MAGILNVTEELSRGLEEHGLYLAPGVNLSLPFRFETPVRMWPAVHMHQVSLGAYTYVAPVVSLRHMTVGRYCSIGDNLNLLTQHPTDWLTAHPFAYSELFPPPYCGPSIEEVPQTLQTTIGNDVWIGSHVSVKSGVTIGDGALIGANATVTKDVPPFAVVGGVPARVIRLRFTEALIERIRALPWWDWDLRELPLDWRQPERAMAMLEEAVAAGRVQRWAPGWRLLDFGTPSEAGGASPLVFLPG